MKVFGAKIQESGTAEALKSTLGSDSNVDGIGTPLVTKIEEMIRKVYAEEFDPKSKKYWRPRLSWSPAEAKNMIRKDSMIGEWNPLLPSIWSTNKTWVIQNCILMNAAGQRITLEDLSDSKQTWVDKKDGTPHVAPSDRERARVAMETYRSLAMEDDPLFCEHCEEEPHRAKDWDDRTRHIYRKHPAIFAGMVDLPVEESAALESAIPDVEETKVDASGTLICCGKKFSSVNWLNRHRATNKNHKG